MSCRPLALGSTDQLGTGSEARNATVLGLNDVDKQKLEEARQLAMSMTSHPVAFGTIEHTERAGELLGLLWQEVLRLQCDMKDVRSELQHARDGLTNGRTRMREDNERLAREAHTWSKAAETYATQLEHHKPLVQAVRNVLEEGQLYAEDLALLRQALEQVERALGPNHAPGPMVGSTRLLPKDRWGDNFREDPECPGQGVYMRCPHCGRGERPSA